MSVKAGGSLTIPCLYDERYKKHVKYLCKGYYWNFCSIQVKTNTPSDSYLISDSPNERTFKVTFKNLTPGNVYYWCAVEINGGGDERQYFHLSVTQGK